MSEFKEKGEGERFCIADTPDVDIPSEEAMWLRLPIKHAWTSSSAPLRSTSFVGMSKNSIYNEYGLIPHLCAIFCMLCLKVY